jgi:hypothetical protein
MSIHEVENLPTVAAEVSRSQASPPSPHEADDESQNEQLEDSLEHAIPDVKSGVYNDPTAAMVSPNPSRKPPSYNGQNAPSPRFFKNDTIHMSEKINNSRGKVICEIYKSRYNSSGFTEYQLVYPGTRNKYNGGSWYRENLLKLEERAR